MQTIQRNLPVELEVMHCVRGVISACLANMALDGLEEELKRHFRVKDKVNLIRYADDGVVTGVSKELLEQNVLPVIENFMRERGLELSKEKTRIVHIREGFDFLGQNVRKYGAKLLITPAWKNIQAFLDKVRDIVKEARAKTQAWVIERLNPILRGWANFHRHIVAKSTFRWVDMQIFSQIWRWARRRHPNKGARWVKQRYFHRIGDRNWVFTSSGGKIVTLYSVASTPIRRHVKIKGQANPFHPDWIPYFKERKLTSKIRKELDFQYGGILSAPVLRG